MAQCTVCGSEFAESDLMKLGEHCLCPDCERVFRERLREGLPASPAERSYGGFWIRVGAQLLDWIVLSMINVIVGFAGGFMGGREMVLFTSLLSFVIGVAYVTYFLGRYDATPGKMACGLRVIRADGGKISYARAFGRLWASYLSAMTFGIGYFIAAFDGEKRTLHDRICDTRVVKA